MYVWHRHTASDAASAASAAPASEGPDAPGFGGNPYLFLGPRPFREARLRSYIIAQHRRGRPLAEILDDAYVRRCGGESLCWRVVADPRTLEALERDIREAFHGLPRRRATDARRDAAA